MFWEGSLSLSYYRGVLISGVLIYFKSSIWKILPFQDTLHNKDKLMLIWKCGWNKPTSTSDLSGWYIGVCCGKRDSLPWTDRQSGWDPGQPFCRHIEESTPGTNITELSQKHRDIIPNCCNFVYSFIFFQQSKAQETRSGGDNLLSGGDNSFLERMKNV